ncbi:MAG TPA: hypothetical protein VEU62_20105 [Bryobacterales bacterium]|nr:hypothetical protein [Bryobacterales bacterium]
MFWAARIRQISLVGALLLVVGLFALATQAKLSQYHSKDSPTHYLSKSVKMRECRAEKGDEVQPSAAAPLAPDEPLAELAVPFSQVPLPKAFSILRPFEFRPPPALFF